MEKCDRCDVGVPCDLTRKWNEVMSGEALLSCWEMWGEIGYDDDEALLGVSLTQGGLGVLRVLMI